MKAVRKTAVLILLLLAIACSGVNCVQPTHDDAFTEQGLLEANAADLKRTEVTPHLDTPIAEDQNVLWCGSFQLAWNEACRLVGEDLHFRRKEPAMVALLNKKSFTSQHIDEPSYVAVADFISNDVHGQIARQLEDKFAGRATPRYVPPRHLTPRPQDIVAYAYLFKNLAFEVPFERIAQPIVFGTRRVPCFGVAEERKSKHVRMLEQLVIWDYQDEDDFVIELKTKSTNDRFVLAKIRPKATLAETIEIVQKRIADSKPQRPKVGDVLKVPKLNFDITREYRELEGRSLTVANPTIAKDLLMLSALQNVRFQVDEKGVRLRSKSRISLMKSSPPSPLHIMVLDKPFLIMLQRKEAKVPYFALWIGNAELLVKTTKPGDS